MAKKKKYQYKFVRPDELAAYKEMSKEDVLAELLRKNARLLEVEAEKKSSVLQKELAAEIAQFRKNETSNEIEQLQEELKALKEKRDEPIAEDAETLKDIKAGFRDAIAAQKEYVKVLLSILGKMK